MYEDIPLRIQRIYSSCTEEEQAYLVAILQELAATGRSPTYENIWLADFKEIPVDIDTFIEQDMYLGKTNRNGAAVYPEWRKVFRDIFLSGKNYDEIVFTGATRIGKSSSAITCTSYMLYWLMCLRDPQRYFGKKDISKFSILFFNVTKDLAKQVGFREFNDTLKASPWFNAHGAFSRSDRNFYYIPEGDKISIDFGSTGAHALGQQVFVGYCLLGNTRIITSNGSISIEQLAGKYVNVLQYNKETKTCNFVNAHVELTQYVKHTVRITLEDGTILEGTPEHPIMLSDGSYKCLGELTLDDDILICNE